MGSWGNAPWSRSRGSHPLAGPGQRPGQGPGVAPPVHLGVSTVGLYVMLGLMGAVWIVLRD
jgi:hypothetical protein